LIFFCLIARRLPRFADFSPPDAAPAAVDVHCLPPDIRLTLS